MVKKLAAILFKRFERCLQQIISFFQCFDFCYSHFISQSDEEIILHCGIIGFHAFISMAAEFVKKNSIFLLESFISRDAHAISQTKLYLILLIGMRFFK